MNLLEVTLAYFAVDLVGGIGGVGLMLAGCAAAKKTADKKRPDSNLKPGDEDIATRVMNEINEKIQDPPEEKPVNKAAVTCTCAENIEDVVYILKESKEVLMEDLAVLSKSNIKMSGSFQKCCNTEDQQCPLEREIEDLEWKDCDQYNSMDDGEEVLEVDKSYLSCLTGYGIIYFINSGQKMKDFADSLSTINHYISEEIFELLGWDVPAFKSVYGEDVLDQLKKGFMEAGITDEISICMFLATIGEESKRGKTKQEDYTEKDSYSIEVSGIGLMQITGMTQQDFFKWLMEKEVDPELKSMFDEYQKGYDDSTGKAVWNNENKENKASPYSKMAIPLEFLSENYAIESAIWYWGYNVTPTFEDVKKEQGENYITVNEFVTKYALQNKCLDNVFLASQIITNGVNWSHSRRQKIALQKDPNFYKVEKAEDKSSETIVSFTIEKEDELEGKEMIGSHSGKGPNGYIRRLADFHILLEEMERP